MDAKTKNIMLVGIGLAGAGLAGYFSWQYLKKKQDQESPETPPAPAKTPAQQAPRKAPAFKPTPKPAAKPKQASGSDNFPLKKGSRGARVKTLQQALLTKYGKSTLPRYGADGDFGAELVNALKKLKLPDQISETTFNVLTEGTAPDPSKLAAEIFKGVQGRNHAKVLAELKKLQSKADYTAVSNAFKNYRIDGGYRKSLVTGVLDNFADAGQKQKLKLEFERMGLIYKKDVETDKWKWSLAGTDSPTLVTTKPTWVWKSKTEYVKVPKAMVLGRFAGKEKQFIRFENDNRFFLVRADAVTRL